MDCCLEESSEHSSCKTGRSEDSTSLSEFASCIPGAEDVVRSYEGAGFCDSLEEADGHDVSGVFGCCGDHGESSPDYHHAWEEDAWLEVVEGKIGWDLSDDISII